MKINMFSDRCLRATEKVNERDDRRPIDERSDSLDFDDVLEPNGSADAPVEEEQDGGGGGTEWVLLSEARSSVGPPLHVRWELRARPFLVERR